MRRIVRNSALTGMLAAVALLSLGTSADAAYGLGLFHGIVEDYRQGDFCGNGQGLINGYCQGVYGVAGAYGGLGAGYFPCGPAGPAYGSYVTPGADGLGVTTVHTGMGVYGGNAFQRARMGVGSGFINVPAGGGYGGYSPGGGGFR